MDVVKEALGNRGMMVEAGRQCGKYIIARKSRE